ncbi:MAG TPA: hypothetical protein PKA58_17110 [Polyangium sp.]|jgi:hypothetical protein|nr:hypothetical protein [Polyangium sp.]
MRLPTWLLVIALACVGSSAAADTPRARTVLLDRVAVRWHAPETGGVEKPQFIFERELAFEARIAALADPDLDAAAYSDRHVRAALERHIAETLLSNLPVMPAPTAAEIASRAESARAVLEQRVRGRDKLLLAAKAEGIASDEIDALLRRQAAASLYLDRMVAPMLEPSEPELRALLATPGATPFSGQPYDKVALALGRWIVAQRLGEAIATYYQTARSRVVVTLIRAR